MMVNFTFDNLKKRLVRIKETLNN